jgi:type II secretory pathway component PulF
LRQYRWRARSGDGRECSGEILADSEQEVARYVRAHYGCVTGIEKADRAVGRRFPFLHGKTIHHKQRAVFFRQMATLLEAGISFAEALDMMTSSGRGDSLSTVSRQLGDSLKQGLSLSAAMRKQAAVFPPSAVAMVEAGEQGGDLVTVLQSLAVYYERQDKLLSYVRNVSIYPLFLVAIAFATIVFFSLELLPMFVSLYASLGVQETQLLRTLLFLKRWSTAHFPALVGLCIVSGRVLYQLRGRIRSLFWSLPGLHGLRQHYLEVRFVKMLALLLHSGISLPEAIHLAVRPLADGPYRLCAERFAQGILHGIGIAAAAGQAGDLFSRTTREFLRIGENSGNLAPMLTEAARIREQELMNKIRELKTIAEPLLIMGIAAVVFTAIAVMISPLFSIMTQMPAC